MKLTKAIVAFIATSPLVSAECPNACAGHGVCGAKDMCTCERNWQGSDCSLRTCPFGISHVDIPKGDLDASSVITDHSTIKISGSTVYPYGTSESFPYMVDTAGTLSTNTAHDYAECSNKGLCDRVSGNCECLPGYDGASCQRASCPSKGIEKRSDTASRDESKFINQRGTSTSAGSVFQGVSVTNIPVDTCSGNGICKTIEELASDDHNNSYELWDKESSMGCSCDPGYAGADCSERQCAYGIDPLWTDDTTARVTQTAVRFKTTVGATLTGQYAIKFYDVFGEDYITAPLDLTATGVDANVVDHCDFVKAALIGLPNRVVPAVECSQAAIETDKGFEYTLTFTGNPGKLRQLEIIENLDGERSTVLVSSGAYAANVYTKVNGEFVDNFAEKCDGVSLKVIVDSTIGTDAWGPDVRPGSLGYLEILTPAEERLFKSCLGDSDGDVANNVNVANWDEGFIYEADGVTLALTPPGKYKMIGAFPHAIKVVPKESTSGYNMYTQGQYYLVWFDDTATLGKQFRVANVNDNINDPSLAEDSYVFTTKGKVRQLGWGTGTELADNQLGSVSTHRIAAYFDSYSNKVFTNYDTSCENQPSASPRNHQCVEKGDKLFIVDSCWGKGNSGAAAPVATAFFGGSEVSCADSSVVNHNTGNLYTVTKVYKQPLLTALSTTNIADVSNIVTGDPQTIVDTFVIEVDGNLGWEGQMGDPENTDTAYDTTMWSDNTGIVTLFHFTPDSAGKYEYVSQCSNRGLCDNLSGICSCFSGYTGFDCSVQNALAVASS